jgi:hypothetical protein
MRRKRKWERNCEGAATVGRKVEPWRKYGARTIEFIKYLYCKGNSKYVPGKEQNRGKEYGESYGVVLGVWTDVLKIG